MNEDIVKRALAILNRRSERPEPKRGITLADVLEVCPGAKIVPIDRPKFCQQPTFRQLARSDRPVRMA